MSKEIVFIHGGGGQEDFEADALLADSLRKNLGDSYTVHYPFLPENSEPDFGRMKQISEALSEIEGDVILVGHSLGASMILKFLSENSPHKKISGIFLLSTPFWSGDEDWKQGLKLKNDFEDHLPKEVPVFLYHCLDDEVVSFEHFRLYAQHLPKATLREIKSGGHQLNNDLRIVARDILVL
jgi:predicted alpha/beta hydrolase family esterase